MPWRERRQYTWHLLNTIKIGNDFHRSLKNCHNLRFLKFGVNGQKIKANWIRNYLFFYKE